MRTLATGLAACVLSASQPAPAAALDFGDLNAGEREIVRDYVVSNVVWTLLHETGHMLIDTFELPVLGHAEDAADAFATIVMLDAKTPRMDAALRNMARQWLALERESDMRDDARLADEHALPKQRGFAMLCMMIEKDPNTFAEAAKDMSYPGTADGDCYSPARRSWAALLVPRLRMDGATRIAVTYEEGFGSEDEVYTRVRDWMKTAKAIETVMGMVGLHFAIDGTLRVAAEYCSAGDPRERSAQNSWWMKDENKIVICYEDAIASMDSAVKEVARKRKATAERASDVVSSSVKYQGRTD